VCSGTPSECEEQAGCGNGNLESGEACDDGNTENGDYCSSNCQAIIGSCGDDIVQQNVEECDDGNDTDEGNGCSDLCLINAVCGDTLVQSLYETCDDGNVQDDNNGCDGDCLRNDVCGNFRTESLFESCDDGNTTDSGNGCDGNCQRNDECGDGDIQSLFEEYDDGNTTEGDGCGPTCENEIPFLYESEPNQEVPSEPRMGGGPGTVDNDFDPTMADGPISETLLIVAAIDPAGDEDVFRLSNPTFETVWASIETYGPSGRGHCAEDGIDTTIFAYDDNSVLLGTYEDIDLAAGNLCSRATLSIGAKSGVYINIIERSDNAVIPAYRARVDWVELIIIDPPIEW
jgi:cysteine-rich repeat protein